jgi:integrase
MATQVSRTVRGGKREAERVARELELRPARGAAGRTVADLLQTWVGQNESTWSPASQRDQRGRADAIAAGPLAELPVARLSVSHVERWHAQLRKSGMGDAGIRNQHAVLRAALAQAVRWGWVSANVASLAQLRSSKSAPREGLTNEQVSAVLAAAETIDAAAALALRLAAVSGARRAELASLRWSDVRNGVLTVDSSVEVVSRNEGVTMLRDAATKTANQRRVTLDDETLARIETLRREREEFGPYLFGVGDDCVNPDRIGWWWTRARRLAGLPDGWRLHDLRHWSATVAIGQGHNIRTVAGRLGHANPSMTLRVYAHAFANTDQPIATGLADVLRDCMK